MNEMTKDDEEFYEYNGQGIHKIQPIKEIVELADKIWAEHDKSRVYVEKRFPTILADPPWNERGGGKIKRGADRHYPLMKTEQIMALPVSQLAEDNAHLYLWVTNGHLPDGLRVMEAWGFKYKTNIAWAKDRIGLGQYFRGQHELCLFGVRGNIPYRRLPNGKRAQGRTLITEPRSEHSRKPESLRKMIEVVSPGPYLELFAREAAPGWDIWGNEVESTIKMPERG